MFLLIPERWQVLSPYLDRALEIGSEDRSVWLESLRNKDPELVAEALLDERDALSRAEFLSATTSLLPSSLSGQRFGAYTLLSLVGLSPRRTLRGSGRPRESGAIDGRRGPILDREEQNRIAGAK